MRCLLQDLPLGRPISIKSNVDRKHDACHPGALEDITSISLRVSRRGSPLAQSFPTLAPNSNTEMSYDYFDDTDLRISSTSPELIDALGVTNNNNQEVNFSMPTYSCL